MNCEKYQEAMSLLVDGAATDDEMRLAFRHLHECEECRLFFRTSLEIRSTLGTTRDVVVPAELDERVLSMPLKKRVRGTASRFTFPHQWKQRIAVPTFAVAIAVVIVVLASVMTVWQSLRSTQAPPPQKVIYVVGLQPVEVQETYSVASSQ